MVYKNFFLRSIFSLLLFILYLISAENFYNLFFLGTIIYLIIIYEIYFNFNKLKYIILFYTIISFFCFFAYLYYYFNYYFFNFLVIIIIIFDISSYFIGKLFGKNKIFKTISPKKTLEGYLGGVLFINTLYFFYLILYKINFEISNLIFLNLIVVSSVFGDLTQSYFKRRNNLKDSSNFLPGHGGFFDRFDSFMLSIIFLYLYNLFQL